MIELIELKDHRRLSLDDYAADAKFVNAVSSLRSEIAALRPKLAGRTLWMVNSTARGGGVAEMIPRMCAMMGELGLSAQWAVIHSDRPEFFRLTKRIHNLIHGQDGDPGLGAEEAALFEAVNRENAESLRPHLRAGDVLIVHDPQPLPLGPMLRDAAGVKILWRCHIGLDVRNRATAAAWRFLRPTLESYDYAAFSVPEYIPDFMAGRASVLTPALDPISHKNRDLLVDKLIGILCNSGLQEPYQPVPSEPYREPVRRVLMEGTGIPGEIGLLFRPIVLQVSRWDRLKGWMPLLEGFLRLKARSRPAGLATRKTRRVGLSRLVLAGPDPASVADDPEGREVFEQVCARYRALGPEDREDVIILELPMSSRKHNGLIVNALQRCATVVVQNSIQEGFGLTATEAMWKHAPVLGTQACGLRQQIRDGIDGLLTSDPEDPDEIAGHLESLLVDPIGRYRMGRNGQLRVYEEYLIFRQIARYAQLVARML